MEAKQARPHSELIAQLLDSRIPKTEREHAAAREIERLRADLLQELVDAPEPEQMSDTKDGGSASPLSGPLTTSDNLGMTLRDYFAAHAMTAIVSLDRTYKAETAEIAYGIADAMLAVRDKK